MPCLKAMLMVGGFLGLVSCRAPLPKADSEPRQVEDDLSLMEAIPVQPEVAPEIPVSLTMQVETVGSSGSAVSLYLYASPEIRRFEYHLNEFWYVCATPVTAEGGWPSICLAHEDGSIRLMKNLRVRAVLMDGSAVEDVLSVNHR